MGINAKGSAKCQDMLDKIHFVQRQNSGGGVVLATATPVTNSITDAYIVQRYLQNRELALLELQSFDSWVGMFAERSTEFEIDVDTSCYRLATRFSKFHNMPELTSLLALVADFHQNDASAGLPQFHGYEDALIPQTKAFADYLKHISARADMVRAGLIPPRMDNMLKITTDGRKAALDMRLVQPDSRSTWQCKTAQCAENVFQIYQATEVRRGTQLIFCDVSTPKSGFNIYDELKQLLVRLGVPAEEIAYIHDAETEWQRTQMFEQIRSGELRILIGSTPRLGLGVNIQDHLIALHHLDVPWRPADMTQREGRILRQGNQNETVYIYRYITEGSFDAYSWQLLETKQRFISQLLSGSLTQRSGSDIEDTVLDYAEVKALAVGDPLIRQRVEAANELAHLRTLQRKTMGERTRLEQERALLPEKISGQMKLIQACERDLAFYQEHQERLDKQTRSEIRRRLFSAVCGNEKAARERALLTYQGFQVVLPANMTQEKPFVWLRREGRYRVEMGTTELGGLTRIDHFLEHLAGHLKDLQDTLDKLRQRERVVRRELETQRDYTEQIRSCQDRLSELDHALGVDRQAFISPRATS